MSMNSFHARATRTKAKAAARPVAHAGVRADALLVRLGLAASRSVAQRLIEAGRVRCEDRPIDKPSLLLAETARLSVAEDASSDFVSRGGDKLAGALRYTGLDVRGRLCLDVGQSTGGFTDCLLRHGAAHVLGVDVGHGQLAPRLRADARVTCLEGVNARELRKSVPPARRFDLIVADVSFISLTLILPELPPLWAPQGEMLLLVKPQFEVGPQGLGKGGIVRDAALYAEVEDKLRAASRAAGLRVRDWFESPITGGDGNREFFLWTSHD